MGFPNSKHVCRDPRFRAWNWPHRLPIRHHLQRDLLRAGLYDGIDRLLLPASPLLLGAVQAGALLHRSGDLHCILPLHPDLQLLRRRLRPMRCRGWRDELRQVRPGARLHEHRPLLQRCLPLHGLAPDRAPAADRVRARDEAVPLGDQEAEPAPWRALWPDDPERLPWRELRRCLHPVDLLDSVHAALLLHRVHPLVGLKESQDAQPECVRDQVKWACWATVISWCTYPIVYILPMMSGSTTGKAGLSASSMVAVQVGYTVSDVISKCGVGFLVYNIALSKSMMERGEMEDGCVKADV